MAREFCVSGEELERLLGAPVGSAICNGPRQGINRFVKTGADEWRPCDRDFVPWSGRPWEFRFSEPLHLGPFASEQLHSGVVFLGGPVNG